jgi:hypothetical protein
MKPSFSGLDRFLLILCATIICVGFIGVPLAWLNPLDINPDPYFHIQLANYYLYAGNSDARDALTVGPLIPAIYAVVKWVGLYLFSWKTAYEIYLIKLLSFACFLIISITFTLKSASTIGRYRALVLTSIFLAFMQVSMDALSPNGELVAVTWMAILIYILDVASLSLARIFVISLISTAIIYTKIQAIPLLALLLLPRLQSWRNFKHLLIISIPLLLGVEVFLYAKGAGIFYNLATLYKYVSDGAVAGSNTVVGKIEFLLALQVRAQHILWICNQTILNFPILIFIVIAFVFSSLSEKSIFKDWRIYLFVTIFTMILPGRQFEHYTMFSIPFILLFSASAIDTLRKREGDSSLKRLQAIKFLLSIFVLLSLFAYKSLISFPGRDYFNGKTSFIYSELPKREALIEVKKILDENPGSTFIHGWDYSVNLYLDQYSNRFEIPMLMARAISEKEYINAFESNQYKYILDITQYQGLIKGPEYWLHGKNNFSAGVNPNYELIYISSNKTASKNSGETVLEVLRLYRHK